MTGPLPPLIGGMVTVINDLNSSSLAQRVDLELFNTGKTTKEGRSLFEAVITKLKQWWNWCKLLRSGHKTIAHIHTCSGLTFFFDGVLIFIAGLFSVPVVLHIHGGKFDLFLQKLNQSLLKIVHWLLKKCAYVVVLSDSWQEKFNAIFPDLEFSVVSNGVPIHKIDREYAKQKTNKVQILFLGNLSKNKGIFDLIAAMEKVEGAELIIVGGEDEPGISQRIQQALNKQGLDEKIKLVGPKHGDEKKGILQAAEIYVLPSYAEGLPISLLEAMAVGLPVIVTPVGGIPSVINDNQEGVLVPVGNIEQLANAINRLATDSILRMKMGDAARKRCEEHYGIEQAVAKLIKIYTNIYPDMDFV